MGKISPRSYMLRKVVKVESNLTDIFEDLNTIKEYVAKWYPDKAVLYEKIIDTIRGAIINLHVTNGIIWYNVTPKNVNNSIHNVKE